MKKTTFTEHKFIFRCNKIMFELEEHCILNVSSSKLLQSRSTSSFSASSNVFLTKSENQKEIEFSSNNNDKESLMISHSKRSNKMIESSENGSESPNEQRNSFMYNPKMLQSISSLDTSTQKTVIRLITAIGIMFFLMCLTMIVVTLKYSESVDARSEFQFYNLIVLFLVNFNSVFFKE